MRFLIIHAHPNPESFSRSLCNTAVRALRSGGHEVTLIDLYADDFDPRLTKAERLAYESSNPILDPKVREYARAVQESQGVVFIYPTWWGGLPAILKGWFERVLVPGIGFHLDEHTKKVKPGLSELRHVIGITTYGASRLSLWFFNDAGRYSILRVFRVLAPFFGVRTTWLALHRMDRATADERTEFLKRVERKLAAI